MRSTPRNAWDLNTWCSPGLEKHVFIVWELTVNYITTGNCCVCRPAERCWKWSPSQAIAVRCHPRPGGHSGYTKLVAGLRNEGNAQTFLSVCVVNHSMLRFGYSLDNREIVVQIPTRGKDCSILPSVQTASGGPPGLLSTAVRPQHSTAVSRIYESALSVREVLEQIFFNRRLRQQVSSTHQKTVTSLTSVTP